MRSDSMSSRECVQLIGVVSCYRRRCTDQPRGKNLEMRLVPLSASSGAALNDTLPGTLIAAHSCLTSSQNDLPMCQSLRTALRRCELSRLQSANVVNRLV